MEQFTGFWDQSPDILDKPPPMTPCKVASSIFPAAAGGPAFVVLGMMLAAILTVAPSPAQEPWQPPQAFPEERYEQGWQKNPFTLKTAPVPVQRESFAKDLAIGSMYDDAEGITSVVVVNTKTRERIRYRGQEPGPQGHKIVEAVIGDTRKDSFAVLMLGGEKATLRYDEGFLKQMAAGSGAAASSDTGNKTGVKRDATAEAAAAMERATASTPVLRPGPPGPQGQPTAATGNGQPRTVPPFVRPQPGYPTTRSRRALTAPMGREPQASAPVPPANP